MWRLFCFYRMSLFSFSLKEIMSYDCVLLGKQCRMWGRDLEMWKLLDLYVNSLLCVDFRCSGENGAV